MKTLDYLNGMNAVEAVSGFATFDAITIAVLGNVSEKKPGLSPLPDQIWQRPGKYRWWWWWWL